MRACIYLLAAAVFPSLPPCLSLGPNMVIALVAVCHFHLVTAGKANMQYEYSSINVLMNFVVMYF